MFLKDEFNLVQIIKIIGGIIGLILLARIANDLNTIKMLLSV